MTRKECFDILRLTPSATREEIEAAYKRMVRRYPPEFQPDKFRQVDEAYRSLTSLSYLLERLLSPDMEDTTIDKELFDFSLSPPADLLEKALSDIKKHFRMEHLWYRSDD